MNPWRLKELLDKQVLHFNREAFIEKDPISIPHRFSTKQDIEIAGLFAALFAWGNRVSIINSCDKLLKTMDNAPFDFVQNFSERDMKPLLSFAHRTFNTTDLFYTLEFLKAHYLKWDSLETAFSQFINKQSTNIAPALSGFHHYFFSLEDAPQRTRKHIATPERNSACKRLNMYLRWMVRRDGLVDFGLWNRLRPAQLICPVYIHVGRVARHFNLLQRKQNDWSAALELTARLIKMNPEDPVIYDFALFGMGISDRPKTYF
jgi:uncharacterized protein (TIGR02757 family)